MIDEATVFAPVLNIIKRNAPLEAEREELFKGKTIFFERAFFRILGCVAHASFQNGHPTTFFQALPRTIRISRHTTGLEIRSEDWRLICERTGFATVDERNHWRQLFLSFVRHKLAIVDYVQLVPQSSLSSLQINFFVLFCYFYYYDEEYASLHRNKNLSALPENRHITWSLFEPGVLSQFIAPLRKIKSISDFDERELAQFLRLSGNSLTSLRWVLYPLYTEWFLPVRRQLLQLNKRSHAGEEQVVERSVTSEPVAAKPVTEPSSAEAVVLFAMPQITPEEYQGLGDHVSVATPPLQEAVPAPAKGEWAQEVAHPPEVGDIPEAKFLSVLEEFLRAPGDFEGLFSSVLPSGRESMRRASWRLVERTLLNLRSLFIQGGFHTFGEIGDTVCMSAVKWPYALDDRFALFKPVYQSETWRITRRGVMRGAMVVTPILVVPLGDVPPGQM